MSARPLHNNMRTNEQYALAFNAREFLQSLLAPSDFN
jgi:hypothetical protein